MAGLKLTESYPASLEVAATAMIVNGLYLTILKMELKLLESSERSSCGVIVLQNGTMFGLCQQFRAGKSRNPCARNWKPEIML